VLVLKADGKATDKASVIRSKHSVTEQRRRSKINERYLQVQNIFGKMPWNFLGMLMYVY